MISGLPCDGNFNCMVSEKIFKDSTKLTFLQARDGEKIICLQSVSYASRHNVLIFPSHFPISQTVQFVLWPFLLKERFAEHNDSKPRLSKPFVDRPTNTVS